jgi:hypothetical protein
VLLAGAHVLLSRDESRGDPAGLAVDVAAIHQANDRAERVEAIERRADHRHAD